MNPRLEKKPCLAKPAAAVAMALASISSFADTWERVPATNVELGTVNVVGRRVNTPKESGNNYTVRGSKQAAKLDLELKETPQSISVITQQQMQDQGLQDVQQIMEETPGVTVLQSSLTGMGDAAYYSRGFQIQNYQVDGVMGNANILGGSQFVGMQDSFLYDRSEVIRGSTGLTTGTGDPAASVNFIRKRPLDENKGELNLKYGSWASRRVELDHNQVLNKSGTLRGRIVGTFSTGNSFLDRVKRDANSYAASLEWLPTEKDTFTIGFSNQYRHTQGAPKRGLARHASTSTMRWGTEWKPASYWCEEPNTEECQRYPWERPTPEGGYISTMEEKTFHTVTMPRNFNNAAQWAYLNARSRNFFIDWQHRFNKHLNFNAAYTQTKSSLDHLYADMGVNGYYPQPEVDGATLDFGHNKSRQRSQTFDINLDARFKLFDQDQQLILGYNDTRNRATEYFYDQYNSTDVGADVSVTDCRPTMDYPEFENGGPAVNQKTGEIVWVKGEDNYSYMYQCIRPSKFNNGNIARTYDNPAWTLPISYGGRPIGEDSYRRNYQRGPYFAMKFKPSSWLTLIAGGRWAHYQAHKSGWSKRYWGSYLINDRKYWNEYQPPFVSEESIDTSKGNGRKRSAESLNKFIPYGGLILQLSPNVNVYASYTGILKDNDTVKNYYLNYRVGGGYLPPIEGNSKEFGIKGAFFNGRLNASAAYFSMTQKNYPSLRPESARCMSNNSDTGECDHWEGEFTVNRGYTNKGWDINLAGQITPKWRINAGYVFLKTLQPYPDEIEFQNDAGDSLNQDYSGTYTHPRHTFKMFTSYDFTPKFTAGIGVRWSSRIKPKPFGRGYSCDDDGANCTPVVYDKDAVYQQPSFAVWSAMARWNFRKNAELGVSVNNLFDKKYWSNDKGNFYGAPRNVTVNMKMKW